MLGIILIVAGIFGLGYFLFWASEANDTIELNSSLLRVGVSYAAIFAGLTLLGLLVLAIVITAILAAVFAGLIIGPRMAERRD